MSDVRKCQQKIGDELEGEENRDTSIYREVELGVK